MTKPKPWPKCCAPLCKAEADHHIHASGDNGFFSGHLCDHHAQQFQSCFPARVLSMASLRPITEEMLDGGT